MKINSPTCIGTDNYKILSAFAEKMGGETMKRKLGKRLRSIVGIMFTLVVFAFILLALNSWLGWPTSLLTLAGMLGIAWFVSMFAGEQLTPPGLGTTAASCLAVALAVSIVGFGVPWRLGEEDVRFDYRAMFVYLGSEDNEPLENLVLRWSAPKIENSFIEETYPTWELYYIENGNMLTLEASENGFYNPCGARSSQLEIYSFGYDNTEYGPTLNAWFDTLYPREIFLNRGYVLIDKERASDLTFHVYSQVDSIASWYPLGQENKRIDFSFVVGLYRENILVERFEWSQENGSYGWSWLWPS